MPRITGRELNRRWGVNAAHALYREDGTWYHLLERYPGALFDTNGYVLFASEADLRRCPGIMVGREKNWLNAPAGISNLPGYVRARP